MSAEDSVLVQLRDLLEDHSYREGDKLPSERQLAEELQVSRRSLRNAFSILEAEGKVWRGVGQGTFVGRPLRKLPNLKHVAKATNPAMVVEARLSFEPIAARYAAQRVTSVQLHEMRDCVVKSERARDLRSYDSWDERFHRLVVEASQNSVFQAVFELLTDVWTKIGWGNARSGYFSAEWQRIYTRQHRAIIESIANRDLNRAQNLMLEHWQTIRVNLIRDPVEAPSKSE